MITRIESDLAGSHACLLEVISALVKRTQRVSLVYSHLFLWIVVVQICMRASFYLDYCFFVFVQVKLIILTDH